MVKSAYPSIHTPDAPSAAMPAVPNPRRLMSQFNIAFSLMSIIPLLICCYLITVKFFTINVLQGLNGFYFLLAVVIALLGLLVGRVVIREIFQRLVETNTKLDRLNRMQAHFVNNVAHEFRTPLTIVKGALDNLNDGLHGALAQEQTEPVEMCRREINRLRRLVDDLLDIAHIESGKIKLSQEEVVLQELLSSISQLFTGLLKEHGLTLTMDVLEAPARVTADRDRLHQVFVNLFNNAMKFTPQGGLTLRLRREGQMYRIELEDTGRGIAEEDLDRIFDKFERVGSQESEGSGLGLPIARDIVELHHGRLWAESMLGQGSRFIIQLPASAS